MCFVVVINTMIIHCYINRSKQFFIVIIIVDCRLQIVIINRQTDYNLPNTGYQCMYTGGVTKKIFQEGGVTFEILIPNSSCWLN